MLERMTRPETNKAVTLNTNKKNKTKHNKIQMLAVEFQPLSKPSITAPVALFTSDSNFTMSSVVIISCVALN